VIIGATSGIGRAIAKEYALRGAKVCVVGRRANLLKEVEGELKQLPTPSVLAIEGDFTHAEDMVRVRQQVIDRKS